MEETPKSSEVGPNATMRKACQISLMFQVASDDDALVIKKAIDPIVATLPKKQYNFAITEL